MSSAGLGTVTAIYDEEVARSFLKLLVRLSIAKEMKRTKPLIYQKGDYHVS